eukprot:8118554-Pyramimonas_sp.AAC.1
MDQEMGKTKAEHWRTSGLLANRPDSLTGSNDPELIEWIVPASWQYLTEQDLRQIKIDVEMKAYADSHKNFQETKVFNYPDNQNGNQSMDPRKTGFSEMKLKIENF